MADRQRRLAAIMFTDIVSFSALTQTDEALALELLDEHNHLLRTSFAQYHGREIKTVGDAFLVEFGSALEAVECAAEIQGGLFARNDRSPEARKIRIRIGIHVGDVVETGDDVLGDAVNIASRIHALSDPGGICITQQVYDQVERKSSIRAERLPPAALKNIRQPVTVYRVVPGWEGRAPPPGEVGIVTGRPLAVLPLSNISPDPKDEYFADGLTEELISALSQVPGLSVIARTSVNPYRSSGKTIAQIGAELGVDVVLEGSVRKAGDRIRITLQLIDVPTQRHLWSDTYNREVGDVFAVQADVAECTARSLKIKLSKATSNELARAPTTNSEAYDLYLRALVDAKAPDRGFERAVRSFEAATRLDPEFAEAYAAWANLCVGVAGDERPMKEVMPVARRLAARAIELDPGSSEAHSSLGNIAFQADHDWAKAEEAFQKALEINPSNKSALHYYALMLTALQRFDEAKEMARAAMRVDPAGSSFLLAWTELMTGNVEAGVAYAEQERDKDPDDVGNHVFLGLFYFAAGRRADAIAQADLPTAGASPVDRFDHAFLNSVLGRPEEARRILEEARAGKLDLYVSGADRALLHASLGERSIALDLLEQDLREGDGILWMYSSWPWLDPLREEPRYQALLRSYGLPLRNTRRPLPVAP